MKRTVFTISSHDGSLSARIDKSAPPLLPNWNERVSFGYQADTLPPMNDPAQLQAYGNRLTEGLRAHQAIRQLLSEAFNRNSGPQTLCFDIETVEGRQIRWEALSDDIGDFVALNGRCHIGRIARCISNEDSPRLFEPPLRILAFLSGVGLDATQEWTSLSDAIDQAFKRGLPVSAEICIGETTLLHAADAECLDGMHPAITVSAMPVDIFLLEDRIRAVQPHILHFFCHGKIDMGASFLELANALDHALQNPSGSIHVPIDTLSQIEGMRNAWLVVLNCCEGARAVDELESMAEHLVSEAGLAAAIGMLETIKVDEASRLSGVLYPELFQLLKGVMQMSAGSPPLRVDLSPVLSKPRIALRALDPSSGRWTLPVLYQQEQPFQVFRPLNQAAPAYPALDWTVVRAKAETVAGMLSNLPPDTPHEVRNRMLALLDEAPVVPAALRPDHWGRFGHS